MPNKLKKSATMSVEKVAVSEAATPSIEELQEQIKSIHAAKVLSTTKSVEELEVNSGLNIGVQLDIQKISDIISFMLTNNKQAISLKFEVW